MICNFSIGLSFPLALLFSCAKPVPRVAPAKKERTQTQPLDQGKDESGDKDTVPKPQSGDEKVDSGNTSGADANSGDSEGSGNATNKPVDGTSELPPTTEFGALMEPISVSGFISGWAGIPTMANEYLKVNFYLDGDRSKGKPIGSTRANLVAYDNGLDGDHGFIYDLPKDALDGRVHTIYAYVLWKDKEYPLSAKKPSYEFKGYAAKGEAVATSFAKTGFVVNGKPNSACRSCHAFSYSDVWRLLTQASDQKEWTAEKNYLINKLRAGHENGPKIKLCNTDNSKSAINCDEVVNWWKQEFGS